MRKQKHHLYSFIYLPKNKISYNTLYLAGKEMCKRDEKTSSLLILMKNCFTVGTLKGTLFKITRELNPTDKHYQHASNGGNGGEQGHHSATAKAKAGTDKTDDARKLIGNTV